MSERPRCKTTHKLGNLPETSREPARIIRSVCDRPIGHAVEAHRGRLLVGSEIVGIFEWKGLD